MLPAACGHVEHPRLTLLFQQRHGGRALLQTPCNPTTLMHAWVTLITDFYMTCSCVVLCCAGLWSCSRWLVVQVWVCAATSWSCCQQ